METQKAGEKAASWGQSRGLWVARDAPRRIARSLQRQCDTPSRHSHRSVRLLEEEAPKLPGENEQAAEERGLFLVLTGSWYN